MSNVLDKINEPNDIKKLSQVEYEQLATEIREFLVDKVSKTGGHLASSLGAVELTMALHLFLDFPKDKLVWDVGHQSYAHKLLTGRKDQFDSLRQYEGMSGFPKRRESECDAFDTGHSSTSISVANGLAKARKLSGTDEKIVAVIGDGALSGGMAFEALNNVARMKENMIIVLNDNSMSISENVGGMANYLAKVRTSIKYTDFKSKIENALDKLPGGIETVSGLKKVKDSIKSLVVSGMLFEDMGITYIGPIDGHDIMAMKAAFEAASRPDKVVLVHVITQKGKGYSFAELNPSRFHGIGKFDPKTGETAEIQKKSFTSYFSDVICDLARTDDKLIAITAAMPDGTGLKKYSEEFQKRFFDVGIAEEHAVAFAAGLAAGGYHPVVAIYSTFLQRAYDQIIHDVCLGDYPVIFAVDRAGIVGNDGETHQGIFDISYLSHIPGLTVMAPKDGIELKEMFKFAAMLGKPAVVRYPRGEAGPELHCEEISLGKSEVLSKGSKVALLFLGNKYELCMDISELLKPSGIEPSVVNLRFAAPFDKDIIRELSVNHDLIVTIEENVLRGGIGESIAAYIATENINADIMCFGIGNHYVEQGSQAQLREQEGLSAEHIAEAIIKKLG